MDEDIDIDVVVSIGVRSFVWISADCSEVLPASGVAVPMGTSVATPSSSLMRLFAGSTDGSITTLVLVLDIHAAAASRGWVWD